MALPVMPPPRLLRALVLCAALLLSIGAAQGVPPQVAVDLDAPVTVLADADGRFSLSVTVASDVDQVLPLDLQVVSSAGVVWESATRLRGVLGRGARPQLQLSGRLLAESATLSLVAEPYGVVRQVEVRRAGASMPPAELPQALPTLMQDPDWRVDIAPGSKTSVIPGEVFELQVTVERRASSPGAYSFRWLLPAWLVAEESLDLQGVLAPAERVDRTLRVRVVLGGPSVGVLAVVPTEASDRTGHPVEALALLELQRSSLLLHWGEAEAPWRGVVGEVLELPLIVENPAATAVAVEPLIFSYALTRSADEEADGSWWLLQPGLNEFQLRVLLQASGSAQGELVLRTMAGLVSEPLPFAVEVIEAPLPLRRTTLTIEFELEQEVDELFVRQSFATAGTQTPGPVVLNGAPFEAPRQALDGSWWWRIPASPGAFTLTYEVTHQEALGVIPAAEVTARRARRDIPLLGNLRSSEWPASPATMLQVDQVATSEQSSGWRLLAPAAGAVFRIEDATELSIEGPRSLAVEVLLNGEPLPDELVGGLRDDLESGRSIRNYVAVPWRAGENRITLRSEGVTLERQVFLAARPAALHIEPVDLTLGSIEPWLVRVRVLDDAGHPVGFGPLDVRSERRPAVADAFPEIPGWQTLLRDGEVLLAFEPSSDPLPWGLEVRFGSLVASERLIPTLPSQSLSHAQGSLALLLSDEVRFASRGSLYLEQSSAAAALQLALSGEVGWSPETGWRFVPGWQGVSSDRFSFTGVDSGDERALSSDDGFAFRLRASSFAASYERAPIRLPALRGELFGSALRASFEPRPFTRVEAFAALIAPSRIVQRIDPDGRRRYLLDATPTPGSLRVLRRVEQADGFLLEERPLVEGVDYQFEPDGPALLLRRVAFGSTLEGDRVSLHLSYQSLDAPRTDVATGVAVVIAATPWTVRAALAQFPTAAGDGLEPVVALEGGYASGIWSLQGRWSLQRGVDATAELGLAANGFELFGVRAVARVDAELGQRERLDATLTLRPDGMPLNVDAALALRPDRPATAQLGVLWRATPDLSLSLRGEGLPTSPTVELAARQRLAMVDLEAAVRYRLDGSTLRGSLSASVERDDSRLRLEHAADLRGDGEAITRADAAIDLFGVRWVGGVSHSWGGATTGTFAVEQRLAEVTLRAEVELPSAARAAHARFTVAAPWRVSEMLALDVLMGTERDLSSGLQRSTLALGARFEERTWQASVSAEARFALATELLLFGDGQVRWGSEDQHRFLLQSRLQLLPQLEGSLTLSQASFGRQLSFLGYQRLKLGEVIDLDGELALDWRPALNTSLRPALAFRYRGADPEAWALQAALGATLYRIDRVSMGAVVYQAVQPLLDRWSTAVGVELSFELAEELALVIGATTGEGPGLVAGGRPGMHLRLDAFGGSR